MSRLLNRLATPVFDAYWRFAAERQRIFFCRLASHPPPWTADPILQKYKFTNAFRASDRVSQYLIRHVIYSKHQESNDLFFRILLFKLFNRISTWELLEKSLGEIRFVSFSRHRFEQILDKELESGGRLYSAAYIMPPVGAENRYKHTGHLQLLDRMMRDGIVQKIQSAGSFEQVFSILRSYKSVGDFLAYQWTIDLNYSPLINFSEMDFIVAGPGAKRGLRKCFRSTGGVSDAELIRVVAESQADEFQRRGLDFLSLGGRPLQLIDCQNLFCEIDKYTRIELSGPVPNKKQSRPKQLFRPIDGPPVCWYPPKWGLNDQRFNQPSMTTI